MSEDTIASDQVNDYFVHINEYCPECERLLEYCICGDYKVMEALL